MNENLDRYLNQLVRIRLKGKTERYTGVIKIIDNEWLLLEYNPVDFLIDGFILINRRYILDIKRTENEIFVEEVIRTKASKQIEQRRTLNLSSDVALFKELSRRYNAIQIELEDETIVYIGKITKVSTKSFRMRRISPKAKWLDEESYKFKSVRVVQVESDYVLSLLIYMESKMGGEFKIMSDLSAEENRMQSS